MPSEFDSIDEALVECVKACGGSKIVGPTLWPEKPLEAAQRHLLACLNENKPERLAPDQVLLVLRMARDRGCHVGINFICSDLGYSQPVPIEPRDEVAELQRVFIESTRNLARLAERIEKLQAPAVQLRAAA